MCMSTCALGDFKYCFLTITLQTLAVPSTRCTYPHPRLVSTTAREKTCGQTDPVRLVPTNMYRHTRSVASFPALGTRQPRSQHGNEANQRATHPSLRMRARRLRVYERYRVITFESGIILSRIINRTVRVGFKFIIISRVRAWGRPGTWTRLIAYAYESHPQPHAPRLLKDEVSEFLIKGATTRPTHAEVIVQNRAAFSIIKSHWFKFSFNSPLECHYLSAWAGRVVKMT